jgi:acyl-CoA thioesterase FadM
VVRDGDILEVEMQLSDWGRKTFKIEYQAFVRGTLCLTAFEVRGLFQVIKNKMRAADISSLKDFIAP